MLLHMSDQCAVADLDSKIVWKVGTPTSGKSWIPHWCVYTIDMVGLLPVADPGFAREERQPIIWSLFSENCMKMKTIRPGEGVQIFVYADPPLITNTFPDVC